LHQYNISPHITLNYTLITFKYTNNITLNHDFLPKLNNIKFMKWPQLLRFRTSCVLPQYTVRALYSIKYSCHTSLKARISICYDKIRLSVGAYGQHLVPFLVRLAANVDDYQTGSRHLGISRKRRIDIYQLQINMKNISLKI